MYPEPGEKSWDELFCFIEDFFECEMRAHNLEWKPIGVNGTETRIFNAAVGSVILQTNKHLSNLASPEYLTTLPIFTSFDDSQHYVTWFGHKLFTEEKFNWQSFRIFLAFLGKVGVDVMRKIGILVADDVVLSTALFVKDRLLENIRTSGGWRAFQIDCLRIVLHQEFVPFKNPIPSAPSELASDPLLSNEHPTAMSDSPRYHRPPPVFSKMDNVVQVLPTHYVPNHKLRPVFCFTTEEPA